MLKAALIRHGQTAGNVLGQYIGRTDQPLSPAGRQALAACAVPTADVVYCSPLRRCLETGQLLYPETPRRVVADLRECDFGDFEQMTYQQLKNNRDYQRWLEAGGSIAFPGGEEPAVFRKRAQAAFRQLVDQALMQAVAQIAVVTHGGVIMAILAEFAEPHAEFYQWQTANGTGYLLAIEPSDWQKKRTLHVLGTLNGGDCR